MLRPLLPSGLGDVLPPQAAAEFKLVHHFLKSFMAFGYQPVIPPLAEYANTLLAGQGEATAHQTFHVMDPLSSQMLAIRADMTGQVARIASSTLHDAPRPLRLCYAGYTLRTAPEALKTGRQHTQVGLERFGDAQPQSVAEMLAISVHTLENNGINGVTVDLHFPSVMQALLAALPTASHTIIRDAVRLKDTSKLRQLGAEMIADIVDCAGVASVALSKLKAIAYPAVQAALTEIDATIAALNHFQITANLTIDLLDLSGYGYYSGIGYAIYWNAAGIEIGRGGCYRTDSGENAAGFTIYINDLLDKLPMDAPAPVAALPRGSTLADALQKQRDGFITVFE
jgi:ATP phosphoribosyltransferase regulatory subunit